MATAEEELNNLVDKTTHSAGQTASFPSYLSLTYCLMYKVAMMVGMEVMVGLSNMDFHS